MFVCLLLSVFEYLFFGVRLVLLCMCFFCCLMFFLWLCVFTVLCCRTCVFFVV